MVRLTLFIIIFLFTYSAFQNSLIGQTEPPEPCIDGNQNTCKCHTSPVLCSIDELDGYQFTMTTFLHVQDGPHGNGFMCPGQGNTVSDNPTWFTFPALCSELTIELCWENCVTSSRCPNCCLLGLQAAVYSECFGCPDCYGPSWHSNSFNPSPFTFAVGCAVAGVCGPATDCIEVEMTALELGKLYYFLVDGCCGTACDVTINILSECEDPEIFFPPLSGIQGPEELLICEQAIFYHPVPETANLLHWFIDDIEVLTLSPKDSNYFEFFWDRPGSYELCFSVSHICSSISETILTTCKTVNVNPISIQSYLFLESALINPSSSDEYLQEMRTDLNTFRVLPGQTYFSFLFGLNYTLPGQPYNMNPWNYYGNEGDSFDSEGNMANSSAGYASTVVDWVLLSLRPGSSPLSAAVWRTAGLLHKDGSIELLKPVPCCVLDEGSTYFLQLQHRNHLLVMSHQAVQFDNGVLSYDFRSQNSYIFDIFGFGAVGQKEVESGVFAMFAGNGDQTIAGQSQIEINFNDKQRFDEDLGIQQQYSTGDYNMDGNTQFIDKLVLIENLGSQSSVNPVTSIVTSEASLDCASFEVNGELTEGEESEEVWIEINYTGGCGEYGAEEINSSGVLGLVASLAAGVFEEEGILVLEVSGTPGGSGTVIFELEIGGQSCTLELEVLSSDPEYPTGTVHCDPDNPTAVVEVLNPTTGMIWMDRNLGASRVAQSSSDSEAYGDLYQWGRGPDGHQCRNSSMISSLSSIDQPGNGYFILAPESPGDWRSPQNTNLWQGLNGVNNPCPDGYRIPTDSEWVSEFNSWISQDLDGAFESQLKLPIAGFRNFNNGQLAFGAFGYYWTSVVNQTQSLNLYFSSTNATILSNNRGFGRTVRCIKDD